MAPYDHDFLQPSHDETSQAPHPHLDWVQHEKAKDRQELASLPAEIAQSLAESILDPKIGRVVDERQLRWNGDLADPWDEPYE